MTSILQISKIHYKLSEVCSLNCASPEPETLRFLVEIDLCLAKVDGLPFLVEIDQCLLKID